MPTNTTKQAWPVTKNQKGKGLQEREKEAKGQGCDCLSLCENICTEA